MRSFLIGVLVASAELAHASPCTPPPEVQAFLDAEAARPASELDSTVEGKRELDRAAPLLVKFPTDPSLLDFVYNAYVEERDDANGWKTVLATAGGKGIAPADALVYEARLGGADKVQAEKALRAALEKDPKHARANLQLAQMLLSREDRKAARPFVLAALEACPNAESYYALLSLKDDVLADKQVAPLRTRLATAKDPHELALYDVVWRIEFLHAGKQAAARRQVAADLVKLRGLGGDRPAPQLLDTLDKGAELLGDKAAKKLDAELRAKLYPDSSYAQSDAQTEWYEALEAAPRRTGAERRALAERSREQGMAWAKRWPNDSIGWKQWLESLLGTRNADPKEVETVTATVQRMSIDASGTIARVYDRYGIHPADIPALVEKDHAADARRDRTLARDLTTTQKSLDRANEYKAYGRISDDDLLVRTFAKLNRVVDAERAIADLEALAKAPWKTDDDDAKSLHEYAETELAHDRGHVLLAKGQKANALALFYSQVKPKKAGEENEPEPLGDSVRKDAEQTYLALGGDAAHWALFDKKPEKKDDEVGWKTVDRPLPDFTLTDLAGKTWTKKALRGKNVVVVLWATWCGPCKMEMPDVKALAKKLEGRKDAVVVSMSVDEESGLVAPFVKENGIEYPVLLGQSVSKAIHPAGGIPYAFIVDKKGQIRAEKLGFDPRPTPDEWVDHALKAMSKLK